MRAAVLEGPGRIEVTEWPDPVVASPTGAVVRDSCWGYATPTSGTTADPARTYIPELLDDVLEGRIDPGSSTSKTDLDGIAEAYAAMDERRAVKSLLRGWGRF